MPVPLSAKVISADTAVAERVISVVEGCVFTKYVVPATRGAGMSLPDNTTVSPTTRLWTPLVSSLLSVE